MSRIGTTRNSTRKTTPSVRERSGSRYIDLRRWYCTREEVCRLKLFESYIILNGERSVKPKGQHLVERELSLGDSLQRYKMRKYDQVCLFAVASTIEYDSR